MIRKKEFMQCVSCGDLYHKDETCPSCGIGGEQDDEGDISVNDLFE